MAYITYITEAIVCGTFNRNSADRSYMLFTKEAGMLYADARSVREERSKQRYALQDFSLVRVSLVKGKGNWKVGSIEVYKNYYLEAVNKEARGSVVNLFRLLRRFVGGEEATPDLFAYTVRALDEMTGEIENRPFVLITVQVQMLLYLGYVDTKQMPFSIRNIAPHDIKNHRLPAVEKRLVNYIHMRCR